MKEAFVLLDDGDPERRRLYRAPERIILARRPSAVPRALKAMRAALEAGFHLAGYASYELGHLLEPRLSALPPERPAAPYLAFGAFRAPSFRKVRPPSLRRPPESFRRGRCAPGRITRGASPRFRTTSARATPIRSI